MVSFFDIPPAHERRLGALAVAFVTLQCIFLQPYVILVQGSRVNMFTSVLCMGLLAWALLLKGRKGALELPLGAVLGCAALAAVLLAGSLHTAGTGSSLFRSLSLLSGTTGFLTGLLLLGDRTILRLFYGICLFGLVSITLLLYCGAFFMDDHMYFMGMTNAHEIGGVLVILLSGAFLFPGKRFITKAYFLFCLAVFLCASILLPLKSLVLFPLFVITVRFIYARTNLVEVVGLLVLTVLFIGSFAWVNSREIVDFRNETYTLHHRIELWSYSLYMLEETPWLGSGFEPQREESFSDYDLFVDKVRPGRFLKTLRSTLHYESSYMTILSCAGILGLASYLYFLFCALKSATVSLRQPGARASSVALAVSYSLFHFVFDDGLLYPNVSWLFFFFLASTSKKTDCVYTGL